MKISMYEIQNTPNMMILETAEKNMSKLEDKAIKTIQNLH